MIAAIYDRAGKLLLYIDGPEDQVRLNIPKGGRLEEVPLERMTRREPPPEQEPPP